MRKILVVIVLHVSILSHAQWIPNEPTTGNIYFNGGNVGIGVATPTEKFHLNGNMKVPFSWSLTDGDYNRPLIQSSWSSGVGDYISIKHGGNNTESGTFGLR